MWDNHSPYISLFICFSMITTLTTICWNDQIRAIDNHFHINLLFSTTQVNHVRIVATIVTQKKVVPRLSFLLIYDKLCGHHYAKNWALQSPLGKYLFPEEPLIVYEVLYVTNNSVTHNSDSKASDSLIDSWYIEFPNYLLESNSKVIVLRLFWSLQRVDLSYYMF